jgi:hypothetical protein
MAQTSTANQKKASHSVRVSDDLWASANRRCQLEGTTMNNMINQIMEGYARGLLNLPKVQITKSFS